MLFSAYLRVFEVVSQQSEPLHFSVRGFGCALFYFWREQAMKVKVRIIKSPYTDVPTKSLEAILRNHAYDKLRVKISIEQLYDIMEVLAERREASGYPFKSNEEALAEFRQYYMPYALNKR